MECRAAKIARASIKLVCPMLTMKGGYLLPKPGGGFYNGRWYTEHALERMAPETPAVMKVLQLRALGRANKDGSKIDETEPRAVLPSMIEAAIANPETTPLTVITSKEGDVITAYRTATQERETLLSQSPERSVASDEKKQRARNFNFQYQERMAKKYLKEFEKIAAEDSDISKIPKDDEEPVHQEIGGWMRARERRFLQKQHTDMAKNIKALQEVKRAADRDVKILEDDSRNHDVTSMRKKLQLSIALRFMNNNASRKTRKQNTRDAKNRDLINCAKNKDFSSNVKIPKAFENVSLSSGILYKNSESSKRFGTLFENWIEPYVRGKLNNNNGSREPLEDWEQSYLKGILSSDDQNQISLPTHPRYQEEIFRNSQLRKRVVRQSASKIDVKKRTIQKSTPKQKQQSSKAPCNAASLPTEPEIKTQLEKLKLSLLESRAKAAASSNIEQRNWKNSADGFKEAIEYLETARKESSSENRTSWREAAAHAKESAEESKKAAQADSSNDESEMHRLETNAKLLLAQARTIKCFIKQDNAKALESFDRADQWKQVRRQNSRALDFYTQSATAHNAKKKEKVLLGIRLGCLICAAQKKWEKPLRQKFKMSQ